MVTTNDKGIIQFKHKVMEEICRLHMRRKSGLRQRRKAAR